MLSVLRPVNSLVFIQDGLVTIRHGLLRKAVLDAFTKGKLTPATIKDCNAGLANRLLLYIRTTVPQQHEPSLTVLDRHEANQLLNRHPLRDYAMRYWPVHLRRSTLFKNDGPTAAVKSFPKSFPVSTTALLLQGTIWEQKPTPVLLTNHTMVTDIYRYLLNSKSVVTLQSIMFMSLLCRKTNLTKEDTSLLHEATVTSNTLLSSRHSVTMQLANAFLDSTTSMMMQSKTDIMTKREEFFIVLVECYKIQYGHTSTVVVSTLNQLVKHYQWTKEKQKEQEYLTMIKTITTTETLDRKSGPDVHLHREKKKAHEVTGINLRLDIEERDETIERTDSYDFEVSLKRAEKYVAEGKAEFVECIYIEILERVTQSYRSFHSDLWEERKLKAVVSYCGFLHSQKRDREASSVLSAVWQEYKHSSVVITESTVSIFHELAKTMKVTGLSYEAMSLFKRCPRYYESTSMTQIQSYKEIQQSLEQSSKEVVKSFSSSGCVTSESILEEMLIELSSGYTDITEESVHTATHSLIDLYITQHRWQSATRLIIKRLHGVWPSLFAPSVYDVVAPFKNLENCVYTAVRLAECYQSRDQLIKEEDIRVRVYRAIRSSRKVDDKLGDNATSQLLEFYSRTSQNEMVIKIRQELLDGHVSQHDSESSIVVKMLWDLAKLTHPRPISIEYYKRIIQVLNKDSTIFTSETFEPTVIVASELWNRALFSDARAIKRPCFQLS
jgi:hypothetical protein